MTVTFALAGNQNAGKSTLFNQLTGNHQYVGNWPGVTIERKMGNLRGDTEVQFCDLPGIYSLSPYSNEEIISRNYLAGNERDAIIDVVDASNLERNLYLTTQLMEFGAPVIVALNQMDIVEKRGYTIKSQELSKRLGVPVVEISALKGDGIKDLVNVAVKTAKEKQVPAPVRFSQELEKYLGKIEGMLPGNVDPKLRRYYAIKAFERDERAMDEIGVSLATFDSTILEAEAEFDDHSDAIITNARYKYVTSFINDVQKRSNKGLSTSEKIDRVLLNRVAALPIFVVIIALVYYISISTVGSYFTDWANDGLFGDGWFVAAIGASDYNDAAEEYDGAAADIDAYLEAASEEGIATDEVALYVGSEAEEDAASSEGQAAIAAFEAEASSAGLTATTHIVDEETAEVDEHEVAYDDFVAATAVEEPAPGDYGPWVIGIPVLCEMGLNAIAAPDWLSSLCLDGIVAGVGAVLGFVPQIMVLFFLLAILEGCGYMARVTYILDRIFRRFGLSGKTFIPMLIGTGCGVPGILASRTIENESSRKLTVMTTTFMPCSAKLPIISLIAAAFFGGTWWVAPLCYFMGIAAIVISGIMLKKTKPFMGETTPYIMELPEYRMPRIRDLLRSMWERTWAFIKKAFTIILLATILVWYLSTYGIEGGVYCAVADMDHSFLAYLGTALAWLFLPLGFGNWEATAGTITGLIAKENLVGTMAVIYADPNVAWTTVMFEGFAELSGGFAACSGFAYLTFNLFCAPCFAAMGCIKREMGGFNKWFWAAIGYEMGFAWCASLMVYQFSRFIAGGGVTFWLIIAVVVLVGMIYMLFRPYPDYGEKEDNKVSAAA